MPIKPRIDDRKVVLALGGASRIGEGPRALGTAKAILREGMLPKQASYNFGHCWSVLGIRFRLCLLSDMYKAARPGEGAGADRGASGPKQKAKGPEGV